MEASKVMLDNEGNEIPPAIITYSDHYALVDLNQPWQFNSLNETMVNYLRKQAPKFAPFAAVILTAKGSSFCSGNNIRWLTKEYLANGRESARLKAKELFKEEFTLAYEFATMRPIQISIWDGYVIGSGAGISLFSPIKVATERSMFSVPRTQ